MSDQPTVILVYQYGKVASTSVVAWLNAVDGVDAFQTHNLGPDACRKMLERTLDPTVSPYFFDHLVGQLSQVIKVGRRMERVESGLDEGRSVIISMARAPVDWFRSAVVQDIVGYLDLLNAISDADTGKPDLGPRAKVRAGLDGMLGRLIEVIERDGGMDAFLDNIIQSNLKGYRKLDFWSLPAGTQFFFTFTRPLVWFQTHFVDGTGERLADFESAEHFWRLNRKNRSMYLMRYEDMPGAAQAVARDLDITAAENLPQRNLSAKKPFADDVAEVFKGDAAQKLERMTRDTDYARFFGYAGAPHNVV